MNYLKVRTRENAAPQGKPRVYFTCYPGDFYYFDEICENIFKAYDCAIYYTEDMEAPLPETYRATDLGQMNLFVIPVTLRLLGKPNRAMDSDYDFAVKNSIPVLPLLMEANLGGARLLELYKKRFGAKQYLVPHDGDLTAIGYEYKLKRYLSSVLLDDETIERVRKAFDAYIFLSYRKKDRHYANELMGLIHRNPMCRDVAVWYDEFLTPGESFNENIDKALEKSDLFALLVTPNLVKEENYVHLVEYPKACDDGKKILPAEMVQTDRKELERQYPGIPDCVNARTDTGLDDCIREALKDIALKANENDQVHNYLIGLAYLEGIDVEVNKEYAIEMLTMAAEGGIAEAMVKLFDIYSNSVEKQDYQKALFWSQKIIDEIGNDCGISFLEANERIVKMFSESEDEANSYLEQMKEGWRIPLRAMNNLAVSLERVGEKEKACQLSEKVLELCVKHFGECDKDTLVAMQNTACAYNDMGFIEKAVSLYQKAYESSLLDVEHNHEETCSIIDVLAAIYVLKKQFDKAIELKEQAFDIQCRYHEKNSSQAYNALKELAGLYRQTGNYIKAFELSTQMFEIHNKVFGILPIDRAKAEMLSFVSDMAKMALKNERRKCNVFCCHSRTKREDCIKAQENILAIYEFLEDDKNILKCSKKLEKLKNKTKNVTSVF